MTRSTEQQIVDNAPRGNWTHYCVETKTYWHNSTGGYHLICNDGSTTVNAVIGKARSRKDIEVIIALEDDKQKLVSLVLRMIDRWWCFVHNATFPSDAARNLLQEASETLANLKRK